MLEFAYATGMRVTEIDIFRQYEDVNLEDGYVECQSSEKKEQYH